MEVFGRCDNRVTTGQGNTIYNYKEVEKKKKNFTVNNST